MGEGSAQPSSRVCAQKGFSSHGTTLQEPPLLTGERKPPLDAPLCRTGTAFAWPPAGLEVLLEGAGLGQELPVFHVSGEGGLTGERPRVRL